MGGGGGGGCAFVLFCWVGLGLFFFFWGGGGGGVIITKIIPQYQKVCSNKVNNVWGYFKLMDKYLGRVWDGLLAPEVLLVCSNIW